MTQTPTITTAETPVQGMTLEQRYYAAAGIYNMTYDDTIGKLERSEVDPRKEGTFDTLQATVEVCNQLYAEMVIKAKDGLKVYTYMRAGLVFAKFRADFGDKWLDPGQVRWMAVEIFDKWKLAEREMAEVGYRPFPYEHFEEAAVGKLDLPLLPFSKLFVRLEKGEERKLYALELRKEFPALAIKIGGNKKKHRAHAQAQAHTHDHTNCTDPTHHH